MPAHEVSVWVCVSVNVLCRPCRRWWLRWWPMCAVVWRQRWTWLWSSFVSWWPSGPRRWPSMPSSSRWGSPFLSSPQPSHSWLSGSNPHQIFSCHSCTCYHVSTFPLDHVKDNSEYMYTNSMLGTYSILSITLNCENNKQILAFVLKLLIFVAKHFRINIFIDPFSQMSVTKV